MNTQHVIRYGHWYWYHHWSGSAAIKPIAVKVLYPLQGQDVMTNHGITDVKHLSTY